MKIEQPNVEQIPYDVWKANNERNVTVYDNDLARGSSIEEAVIIRRFLYLWEKFKAEGQDKIFIQPKLFCEPVGLSLYAFRTVMKKWEIFGWVNTRCMGIPQKKYYRLLEEHFARYLSSLRAKGTIGSSLHLDENEKIASRKREDNLGETVKILNRRIIGEENNTVTPSRRNGEGEKKVHGGFFGGIEKPTFVQRACHELETHIRQARRLTRAPSRTRWQRFMQETLDMVDGNKERLRTVLVWYTLHWKQEMMPQVHSAEDFRDKFTKIEARMAQSSVDRMAKAVNGKVEQIQLTEPEQLVFDRLREVKWACTDAELKQAIRTSFDAHAAFRKRYFKWEEQRPTGISERLQHDIIRNAMVELVRSTPAFVQEWFRRVQQQTRDWKEWSGSLKSYTFWEGHPDFLKMGRAAMPKFEDYLKRLNEN